MRGNIVEVYSRTLQTVSTVFLLMFVLVGCANNPLTTAQTSEQRAFAVLGLYQIVVEEVAVAVRDAAIPIQTRRLLQEAVAQAKPVRQELTAAYLQYSAIRREFEAAETTESRLLLAARNLERWVLELEPIIRRMAERL